MFLENCLNQKDPIYKKKHNWINKTGAYNVDDIIIITFSLKFNLR